MITFKHRKLEPSSRSRMLALVSALLYVLFLLLSNVQLHVESHRHNPKSKHSHSLKCLFSSQFEASLPLPHDQIERSYDVPVHVAHWVLSQLLFSRTEKVCSIGLSIYSDPMVNKHIALSLQSHWGSLNSARGPPA